MRIFVAMLHAALARSPELATWPEPPVVGDAAYLAVSGAGDVWLGTDRGVWARPAGTTTWSAFGEVEGLPAGPASALATDGRGNVWVGTTKGAVRVAVVDGRPVTTVPSPGSCDVRRIVPAGDEVWLECRERSHARHFDGRAWSEEAARPRTSATAPDGGAWIAQGTTLRRKAPGGAWDPPTEVGIRAEQLVVGTDGVWAAEARTLLHLVPGAPPVRIELPVYALALSARAEGGVWVGSEHGRAWIGGEASGRTIETPLDVRFEQRLVRPDGTERWLARGAAVAWDGAAARVVTEGPFHGRSPFASTADAAVPSPDGSVWAVDERGGVTRYGTDGTALERVPGLRRTVASSVYVAAGRSYAIADPHAGLWRLEPDGTWALLGHVPGARVVTGDGAGRVWAVGGVGAWRLDGERLVHVARLPPRTLGAVGALDGAWLLGDAGIGHVAADGTVTLRVPVAALPERFRSLASEVTAATDRAGRVWWGVDGDGILRFDPRTGTVEDLGRDRLVARDGAGRVWTGGIGGIAEWADGTEPVRRIGRANVRALAFDARGRAWVDATEGLLRLGRDGSWETLAQATPGQPSADAEGAIWWSGTRFLPDGKTTGMHDRSPSCAAPVTTAVADGWYAANRTVYRLGATPGALPRPWAHAGVCSLLATADALWVGLSGGAVARRDSTGWHLRSLPVSRGADGLRLGVGWDGRVWAAVGSVERFLFERDGWVRLHLFPASRADGPADAPPVLDAERLRRTAIAPWAVDGAGTRWVLASGWVWRAEADTLVPVVRGIAERIAGDPTGGVWVGGTSLHRITPDGTITDHSERVPGRRLEDLRVADGRLWLLGRAGTVVSAPPWETWTRDGEPYHNDRRPEPGIEVRRDAGGSHGGPWEQVPGLPTGTPQSVQPTEDGRVVVRIDGERYRLSAADWEKVAARFPPAEEHAPAPPGGPFVTPAPDVASLPVPRRSWLRGRFDATLSDRVAAFVVGGRVLGRPDLPLPPVDGVADGDRWWLLLEDGSLLAGEGGTAGAPEALPVGTPMALARAGARLCVGGETLVCREDGGSWRTVPGVEGVVRLATKGGELWAGTVAGVCRVESPVSCTSSDTVTDLVADGAGGVWVLSPGGVGHLVGERWARRVPGRWSSLSWAPDGRLVLAGATLTRLDPATGARQDTPLHGVASDLHVSADGAVRVRIGEALAW